MQETERQEDREERDKRRKRLAQVCGLPGVLAGFRVRAALWDTEREYLGDKLQSPVGAPMLADLMAFLCRPQRGGARTRPFAALREALDDALAPVLDRYVLEVYIRRYPGALTAAPSWLRGPQGRHLRVDPKRAWKVLSIASSKRLRLLGVADLLVAEEDGAIRRGSQPQRRPSSFL